MATFRKRNDKWHVQVRRAGHPSQSKSFISKTDAHKWVRQVEGDMDTANIFPSVLGISSGIPLKTKIKIKLMASAFCGAIFF